MSIEHPMASEGECPIRDRKAKDSQRSSGKEGGQSVAAMIARCSLGPSVELLLIAGLVIRPTTLRL